MKKKIYTYSELYLQLLLSLSAYCIDIINTMSIQLTVKQIISI